MIDDQLVRIHFITEMGQRTGLAPWAFDLPFPGSFLSTFLINHTMKTLETRAETAGPMPTASPAIEEGGDIGVILAGVAGGVGGLLLILGVAYYFVYVSGATLCA